MQESSTHFKAFRRTAPPTALYLPIFSNMFGIHVSRAVYSPVLITSFRARTNLLICAGKIDPISEEQRHAEVTMSNSLQEFRPKVEEKISHTVGGMEIAFAYQILRVCHRWSKYNELPQDGKWAQCRAPFSALDSIRPFPRFWLLVEIHHAWNEWCQLLTRCQDMETSVPVSGHGNICVPVKEVPYVEIINFYAPDVASGFQEESFPLHAETPR